MGYRVSAAQAAFIVRRHERIVRTHLAKGDLPAEKVGGTWQIDTDDLARVPGWRVDAARLAELQARDDRSVSAILARLEALERENRDMRARLRALELRSTGSSISADAIGDRGELPTSLSEGHQSTLGDTLAETRLDALEPRYDLLSASQGHTGLSPDARHILSDLTPRPRRAVPTMRLSSTLPDGLVSVASFAELHGIPAQTWRGAIASGRLRASAGNWKQGRALVKHALDADGRAAFFALWGDREDFQRCAECPHS